MSSAMVALGPQGVRFGLHDVLLEGNPHTLRHRRFVNMKRNLSRLMVLFYNIQSSVCVTIVDEGTVLSEHGARGFVLFSAGVLIVTALPHRCVHTPHSRQYIIDGSVHRERQPYEKGTLSRVYKVVYRRHNSATRNCHLPEVSRHRERPCRAHCCAWVERWRVALGKYLRRHV